MKNPLSKELVALLDDPHMWEFFREGVQVHWFYRTGENGPAAALLKYEPGATVPEHEHMGYEHILILRGAQEDENGVHGEGDLTINPPGTRHSVKSPDGCIVYAVWEKPVRFT